MTYVNICICIAPGAETSNNRIKRDLVLSKEIWRPISFQVDKVIRLSSSYTFYNREISYLTPFREQPKVQNLMQKCLSLSPESDIYVCYVAGDYFKEPHVIGCACSHKYGNTWKGFILLSNSAASHSNMYTLAHELGHILLTRREDGILTNADPDSPNGSVHHSDPLNLMYTAVPTPKRVHHLDHLLSTNQLETALQSPLLRKKR
jgi:hypothetical protein